MDIDYQYLGQTIQNSIANGIVDGFATIPQPPLPHGTLEDIKQISEERAVAEEGIIQLRLRQVACERDAAKKLLQEFVDTVWMEVLNRTSGTIPQSGRAKLEALRAVAKDLLING